VYNKRYLGEYYYFEISNSNKMNKNKNQEEVEIPDEDKLNSKNKFIHISFEKNIINLSFW